MSSLGSRCLGQCTILKSCGEEYKKLTICGRKNSTSVSLKCPRIPATPSDMPAKYVNVSPTNTLLGYQLCAISASVTARKGAERQSEKICASCICIPASFCAINLSACFTAFSATELLLPSVFISMFALWIASGMERERMEGSASSYVPVATMVVTLRSTMAAAMTAL